MIVKVEFIDEEMRLVDPNSLRKAVQKANQNKSIYRQDAKDESIYFFSADFKICEI